MRTTLLCILTLLFLTLLTTQNQSEELSNSNIKIKGEIELKVETLFLSKVSAEEMFRSESNANQTIHYLFFPENLEKIKINIQGAFGGKIIREINLKSSSSLNLKIEEGLISNASNAPSPEQIEMLPELCPRIISKKNGMIPSILSSQKPKTPDEAIYDGRLDFLTLTQFEESSNLYLENAKLNFDYEDPIVFIGYNRQTGETAYEENGGFYSNIHFFVLRYQPDLENLYQSMKEDFINFRKLERELLALSKNDPKKIEIEIEMKKYYDKLHGVENEKGPYQILMHLLFGSLAQTHRDGLKSLEAPLKHGFIPGPFRGSSHWGYSLCEWGDTFYHTTEQTMSYSHFPLWHWENNSPDEKIILVVVEGDDQLRKNEDRIRLEQKGILRDFDYSDDLIGFFIISKNETLNTNKIITSPLNDFELQLRSH